jgi:hypothetical protein
MCVWPTPEVVGVATYPLPLLPLFLGPLLPAVHVARRALDVLQQRVQVARVLLRAAPAAAAV